MSPPRRSSAGPSTPPRETCVESALLLVLKEPQYVWADPSVVPRAKLPEIVSAIVSSLAGPESESQPNPLVLVAHGDLPGFAELKVSACVRAADAHSPA